MTTSLTILQSGGISTFALGPIYLIGVLVPGLAFYRGLMSGGKRYDTLSRLDKLGASLAGGVVSWIPTLVFLRIFGYGPFKIGTSHDLTFLHSIITITVHLGVAYLVGEFVGDLANQMFGNSVRDFNDKQQPWDYTTTKIREKKVTVVSDSFTDPIHGFVARYSSFDDGGDLVLSPVSPESRVEASKASDREENNALYIDKDTISAVFFHDKDGPDEYSDVLMQGDLETPSEEEWKAIQKASWTAEKEEETDENTNGD